MQDLITTMLVMFVVKTWLRKFRTVEISLILDSPTMQSITDRTNGFLDAIKESGVEFNVVGQQDAQGNQQVC